MEGTARPAMGMLCLLFLITLFPGQGECSRRRHPRSHRGGCSVPDPPSNGFIDHPPRTHVSPGCTYGGSPDCVFPCNCADGIDMCNQTTGDCTSQCKDGPPGGFRWYGPGCRVGNVAYGKTTWAKGTHSTNYDTSKAVDGNTDGYVANKHCFHSAPVSGYTGRYWWYVDLGDRHIIYNVTIFTRTDAAFTRLQDFHVYVSDSDNGLDALTARTCADHGGVIGNVGRATLQCNNADILGRYVSVVNSQVDQGHYDFAMCEVVVIGAKAIDCSFCAENSSCDPLNGCQTCPPGKRTPDCMKDCVPGTYGQGCEEACHQCKSYSPICDVITGMCEDGCENWWICPTCSQNIVPGNLTGSHVGVTSVSSSSVIVSFDGLVLENENLTPHYYYVVTISATEQNFTLETSSPIQHNGTKEVLFDGLEPATTYDVQVIPFRVDFKNNLTEDGEPAALVIVTEAETTTTVLTTTTVTDNTVKVTGALDRQAGAGDGGPPIGLTAGLTVGVLIFVALAVNAVLFCIRLKRRQKKGFESSNEQEIQSTSNAMSAPEVQMQNMSVASAHPVASPATSCASDTPSTDLGAYLHTRAQQNEDEYDTIKDDDHPYQTIDDNAIADVMTSDDTPYEDVEATGGHYAKVEGTYAQPAPTYTALTVAPPVLQTKK